MALCECHEYSPPPKCVSEFARTPTFYVAERDEAACTLTKGIPHIFATKQKGVIHAQHDGQYPLYARSAHLGESLLACEADLSALWNLAKRKTSYAFEPLRWNCVGELEQLDSELQGLRSEHITSTVTWMSQDDVGFRRLENGIRDVSISLCVVEWLHKVDEVLGAFLASLRPKQAIDPSHFRQAVMMSSQLDRIEAAQDRIAEYVEVSHNLKEKINIARKTVEAASHVRS